MFLRWGQEVGKVGGEVRNWREVTIKFSSLSSYTQKCLAIFRTYAPFLSTIISIFHPMCLRLASLISLLHSLPVAFFLFFAAFWVCFCIFGHSINREILGDKTSPRNIVISLPLKKLMFTLSDLDVVRSRTKKIQ